MDVLSEIFNPSESEINVDSFLRIPNFLLWINFIIFGPLPEGASKKARLCFQVKYYYNRFLYLCFFWAFGSKIALLFTTEDKGLVSELMLDVVTYTLNEVKVVHFFIAKNGIWRIFQDIKMIFDDQVKRKQNYGVKKYLIGYQLFIMTYAVPIFGLLFTNIWPIIPYLLYGKMKLLLVYWYPFDPYQAEIFPFIYLWVNWVAYTALPYMLACDLIFFASITIVAMEFDILKADLTNILKTPESNRKEEIQQLIDRHQTLFDISDRIQRIYSPTSLLSFVISSIVIGFATFQLSNGHNNFVSYIFLLFYLGMMSAQTLLLCFFGQKLIDASESVAEGAYNCGWENSTDESFKKQLVLIILRSQRAKKLTAMGFADMSLETYTRILAATGSYFSLLKSV